MVYGRSQVGKTELILALMGVRPNGKSRDELKKILRAGRGRGRSSTATALEYRITDGAGFALRIDGEVHSPLDGAQLSEALARIRWQVESNRMDPSRRVELAIPACYFDQPRKMNVIDLPGPDSSTREEHTHVRQLIDRYLDLANIVILVERTENHTGLLRLLDKGIDSWMMDAGSLRIVLSHALITKSIRTQVRRRTFADYDAFRALFLQDMRSEVLAQFRNIEIFPVEVGDTRAKLETSETRVWTAVGPFLEESIVRLRNSVRGDRYTSLRHQAKLYKVFEAHVHKKDKDWKRRIAGTARQLERAKEMRETQEQRRAHQKRRIDSIRTRIGTLEGIGDFGVDAVAYEGEEKGATRKRLTGALLSAQNEYAAAERRYLDTVDTACRDLGMSPPNIPSTADEICYGSFQELRERLESWKIIPKWTDKTPFAARKRRRAIRDFDACGKQAADLLRDTITNAAPLAEPLAILRADLHSTQAMEAGHAAATVDLGSDVSRFEEERRKKKSDRDSWRSEMEERVQRARRFQEFLTEAYLDEYNDTVRRINGDHTSAIEKVLFLLHALSISRDHTKLWAE